MIRYEITGCWRKSWIQKIGQYHSFPYLLTELKSNLVLNIQRFETKRNETGEKQYAKKKIVKSSSNRTRPSRSLPPAVPPQGVYSEAEVCFARSSEADAATSSGPQFWSAHSRLNFTPQDYFWSKNSVKNYQSSYPVGLSDITKCSLSDLTQLLLETQKVWCRTVHVFRSPLTCETVALTLIWLLMLNPCLFSGQTFSDLCFHSGSSKTGQNYGDQGWAVWALFPKPQQTTGTATVVPL